MTLQRFFLFCAFALCIFALALSYTSASADSSGAKTNPKISGPTITPTATSTPGCVTAWQVISSTNPGPLDNRLNDVAALSVNNAWAVGYYPNESGYQTLTLIEHWNGARWETVHSPSVSGAGTLTNELRSIDALAPDNIWAVGYFSGPPPMGVRHTLIEHWDGTEWRIVPSPDGDTGGNYLNGVYARTSNDIWAVGYSYPTNAFVLKSLILHWDGTVWSVVPSPSPSSVSNSLYGISATAADDAWAVGYHYNDAAGARRALVEHWDGTSWTLVDDAPVGIESFLEDVTALGPNDVWAVGNLNDPLDAAQTYIEHWDGSTWSAVPSPNGSQWTNYLHSISSVSSTDIWAAGEYYDDAANTFPLIVHWDGKSWAIQSSPNPGDVTNNVNGISALNTDDVWAVGSFYNGATSGDTETLVERLQSSCATPVPTLTPLPTPTACTIQFTDVPQSSTFYPYTRCLVCRGIASGYTTGCETGSPCFKPGDTITRAQLAKMVSNAANLGDPPGPQRFEDVPADSTFYYFIQRLAAKGYINGYPCGGPSEPCGTGNLPYFRPGVNVTRGQLVKITASTAGFVSERPSYRLYEDMLEGQTFYTYTQLLGMRQIISGYPCGGPGEPCSPPVERPYLRPNGTATRGQAAKIICNAFYQDCDTP